ncbi:MAG: DUF1987 domain-containing protein [Cyclobacteriaceae bacterium]
MESLEISATPKTPEVILDNEKGFISFSGISDEEDALHFYFPILQWLDTYKSHPKPHTEVKLDFRYYNTASAKSLYEVLKRLGEIQKNGQQVEVKWYYPAGDEGWLSEIENFSDLAHLPIQAIEKKA